MACSSSASPPVSRDTRSPSTRQPSITRWSIRRTRLDEERGQRANAVTCAVAAKCFRRVGNATAAAYCHAEIVGFESRRSPTSCEHGANTSSATRVHARSLSFADFPWFAARTWPPLDGFTHPTPPLSHPKTASVDASVRASSRQLLPSLASMGRQHSRRTRRDGANFRLFMRFQGNMSLLRSALRGELVSKPSGSGRTYVGKADRTPIAAENGRFAGSVDLSPS